MFRVIRMFDDMKDGLHRYEVGETYPRAGYKPSPDRIKELSTTRTRQGVPLIEEVPRKKRK